MQAREVPWRLEGADGRLEHCGVKASDVNFTSFHSVLIA